jgi:hypothetical protein
MGAMSDQLQPPSKPVDTKHAPGRRSLRFASIDEALAEVDRLVQAERAGRLKRVGNWTLGQVLGHLATWVEYAYTGAPLKVPFFVKWFLRFQKRRFLYEPMKLGARIPGIPGGTLATELMPLDEAEGKYRRFMERLKTEAPTALNPIFDVLTHEEWIALHLRHAEGHLGFMVPT